MRVTLTLNRRAGVTLIEVLIAIFVVAIGLLALLTLFPLGALSMAQAIRDDRAAQTAANAVATLKVMDVFSDTNITGAMNPGNGLSGSGPSFAVYFDPIGVNNYAGAGTQVGGVPGVTRSSTNWIQNQNPVQNRNALISAWFTSLDDMTFTNDGAQMGVPANDLGQPAGAGGSFQRDGRYSWAAMLRRPHAAESLTEVNIVVYGGRSTSLTAGLAPAGETALAAAPAANNVLNVTLPADIRVGSWVLDATPAPGHGDFYRVTDVTVNANNTADLELQTPLKTTGITQVVLMDNVTEVIFKGIVGP